MTVAELKEKIEHVSMMNPGAMPDHAKAVYEMNQQVALAQLEIALQLAIANELTMKHQPF